MKRCCYELEFLDVKHKFVDDTQTTVQLVFYNELGRRTILAYVHTDEDVEDAETNKESYVDLMFETIKCNLFK